jgi:CheY-like chemotaxis protein
MATVLVVEDEFGIADLIEAVLEEEGHRILMAANGKHGLEMLAQERPDLVFLDYMMPVMDGAGLLRCMAAAPSLRDIPVVIMSSLPEATVAERCTGYTCESRSISPTWCA